MELFYGILKSKFLLICSNYFHHSPLSADQCVKKLYLIRILFYFFFNPPEFFISWSFNEVIWIWKIPVCCFHFYSFHVLNNYSMLQKVKGSIF